jgi:hypothetical protein
VEGCCEQDNEISGYIYAGEFLGQQTDYQIFKKGSSVRSWGSTKNHLRSSQFESLSGFEPVPLPRISQHIVSKGGTLNINNGLATCNGVSLEKLTAIQLVKTFSAFNRTRIFTTVFIRTRHLKRVYPKVSGLIDNEITTIKTSLEATQRVMATKLTRLVHKIAIQLHLVAQSCTICSSRSRRLVRTLLDTPS